MKIKRWSIYRANLDPVVGSEQAKSRLVLVISEDEINDLLNIVNVLPLTTHKPERRIYPNECFLPGDQFGLPNNSLVLCHQIRTLDKQRLSSLYGNVEDRKKQIEIIDALCFQLGINLH